MLSSYLLFLVLIPLVQSEQSLSSYKPLRFSTSLVSASMATGAHVHEPKV